MHLFYDTETTGFPRKNAPLDDPKQARVVQLAAALCNEQGETVDEFDLIILHEGVSIPPEVAEIHGITDEIAREKGVPAKDAIARFSEMLAKAKIAVAHNEKFDFTMLVIEHAQLRLPLPLFPQRACTAELSRPICALPPSPAMLRAGRREHKIPKLSEAYRHFFGKDFDGAHNALHDVRACRDVYFAIKTGEWTC